jgi:hypothetical protein
VGLNVPFQGFVAKGLRKRSMTMTTGDIMQKLRAILIRGLAVVVVVMTYAVGSVGTVGLAGLGLTAATTQAEAGWRGRYWRRGYWRGWYPRRYWYRRRWW